MSNASTVTDMINLIDESMSGLTKSIGAYSDLRANLALTSAVEIAEENYLVRALSRAIESTRLVSDDMLAISYMQVKLMHSIAEAETVYTP
jgi:hypothetical protein